MARNVEQKYFERLDIAVLPISKIKSLIKGDILGTLNAWSSGRNVDKQCFHIVGPAGVGKTQICEQIQIELTEELKQPVEMIMVKSPVLSRDDFIIPFPIVDNGNTSFRMLYSDFVPKDPDSIGLFVIDEFSRGDHSLQQLLWQVQNEYKVHLYDFPKKWFVISIDNPDDSEYQMDTMEDAAGLRRQLHLYTEVSVPDFLSHAMKKEFHPTIIQFIQAHPDFLYDFNAQKVGAVFSNPASYEKLSDQMWKFELGRGIKESYNEIEPLAAGLLNSSKARMFIEFIQEGKDVNPRDIFYDYKKKVRPIIINLKREKDNATLGNIMTGFLTFVTSERPTHTTKKIKDNVSQFLVDMPIDTSAIFMSSLDGMERTSPEFVYMAEFHRALLEHGDTYRVHFYEKAIQAAENGR